MVAFGLGKSRAFSLAFANFSHFYKIQKNSAHEFFYSTF